MRIPCPLLRIRDFDTVMGSVVFDLCQSPGWHGSAGLSCVLARAPREHLAGRSTQQDAAVKKAKKNQAPSAKGYSALCGTPPQLKIHGGHRSLDQSRGKETW
jgi:hypothetical protein